MTEVQIQAACHQWLWNHHPETRRMFFHVPNGGSRNAIEGMQLKASGVIQGIPDCLWLTGGTVIAFEFKTATGKVSPEQERVHSAWRSAGYTVHIIRSLEQFQSIVESQLASTAS